MIGIEIGKVQAVQKKFEKKIQGQQNLALLDLQNITPTTPFSAAENIYLARVIAEFRKPDLLIKEPNQLEALVNSVGAIPPNSQGPGRPSLKNLILEALNYKGLRSNFYPKYFRQIEIKACVYCNSQLTITISKTKNEIKARFDVDHYHPKDDFPFLAICLFNLYPVCASCNRTKSTRKVKFDLYVTNPKPTSDYKFKLDEASKANYLTNFNSDAIKIEFIDLMPTPPGYMTFQEVFSVQEIHDTQKDIVEELIIKSQIYNDAHKEQLRESFFKLTMNEKLFERVIVGNYVEEKDIHKRPLSKMMMDIAKGLKIVD